MTMIIKALRQGNISLAMILIERATTYQLNQYDEQDQTALHLAIQKNYLDIIRALLKKGADLNARGSCPSYTLMTPLHYAALTGNIPATQLLLAWGANTQLENGQSRTATTIAYQHGFTELAHTIERFNNQQMMNQSFNRKILELQNSSVEAIQARVWICKRTKPSGNVVNLEEFKRKKQGK